MPPRDQRPRLPSPHLSRDGFLRLHITLLRLRLRVALTRAREIGLRPLGLRDSNPDDPQTPSSRRLAVQRPERDLQDLVEQEQQLRAGLVVAWRESREAGVIDPIHDLQARLRLGELESQLLLLTAAHHLDPSIGDLFTQLGAPQPLPCLLLVTALSPEVQPTQLLQLLHPDSPLRRFGLLRLHPQDGLPELLAPLSLDPDLLPVLLFDAPPLPTGLTLLTQLPDDPRFHHAHSLSSVNHLRTLVQTVQLRTHSAAITLHTGPLGDPHIWAAAISQQQQRPLLHARVDELLDALPHRDLADTLPLIARVAQMRQSANILLDLRQLTLDRLSAPIFAQTLQRHLQHTDQLTFIAAPPDLYLPGLDGLHAHIAPASRRPELRRTLWERALPPDLDVATHAGIDLLALRPELTDRDRDPILAFAIQLARAETDATPILRSRHLAAALHHLRPDLDWLPGELPDAAAFSPNLLHPATRAHLESLQSAISRRHLIEKQLNALPTGLCALFEGSAISGRSAAARHLAFTTGLIPRRIHLDDETPDKLRALQPNELAIIELRTDIAPYAPDLLQRLRYALLRQRGVVLVEAEPLLLQHLPWLRALDFQVPFLTPPADVRLAIWQRLLHEPDILTDGLDLRALAEEFPIGFGPIRRAAVAAAAHACSRPHPRNCITFQDLWDAATRCCQLLDLDPPDLAWTPPTQDPMKTTLKL